MRGYAYPVAGQIADLPAWLHLSGTADFSADLWVNEQLSFTHRYYLHRVIGGLGSMIGLPLALFSLWLAAGLSWMAALWRIGRRLSGPRAAAALTALGTCAVGGTLANAGLWAAPGQAPGALPTTLALGLVGWGFAFALERRWALAYGMLGAACLVNLPSGILPGVVIAPALALDLWARRTRRTIADAGIGAALWMAGLAAVVVPGTGLGDLEPEVWSFLYTLRHPELQPASWDAVTWVQAAALVGATWLLLPSRAVRAMLVSAGAVVGLGLLATEVPWLAPLALLHPPSVTSWTLLLALLATTAASIRALDRGNHGMALALLLAPLTPWPGFALLILSQAPRAPAGATPPQKLRWLGWAAAAVCGLIAFPVLDTEWKILAFAVLGAMAILPPQPTRKQLVAAIVPGAVATLTLAVCVFWAPWPVSSHVGVFDTRDDGLARIGALVDARAEPGDVFLIPPFVPEFRLYARRAVVVDFQDQPSGSALLTWRDRLQAVYGQPVSAQMRRSESPEALWAARSAAQLVQVAQEHGAGFVLTRKEWHPRAPAILVEEEDGWRVYKLLDSP